MDVVAGLLVERARADNATYQDIRDYRAQCTLDTCPLSDSYWGYLPSLAANGLFIGLFGLSLLLYVGQAVAAKRFLGFSIAMICGDILEVLGYIGRIMAHDEPFKEDPFLLQIVTLTIGPAFFAAGIYFCLSRIVSTISPAASRIPPAWYPRIFIPCDVISLLLQAAGGGLASARTHANEDPSVGNDIMIAGLAFQVITLFCFICLSVDFGLRAWRKVRAAGAGAVLAQEAHLVRLRHSARFRLFLAALAFATLCIFTRCVYRVAELSDGWNGRLIKTQSFFIGLEGAVVGAAVLALNACHPGLCFKEGDTVERGAFGFGRRRKAAGKTSQQESQLGSEEGEVGVVKSVGDEQRQEEK
ncbi:RTA1 like protein-domain-containing protein [Lineolata rhizophorae]|uniref:RTA1 like protein-domain-containing protein n=1 Tax=Lineolata rhizophorae TaxID=578093 RepID=A0A6A6NQC2_9PEZI|nr:RTA1 like protein-domain-containing protein [Lineolata rhizophorae]